MTSRSGNLEHTADLGLWVEADSLAELFESAPMALAELMVSGHRQGEVAWLPYAASGADYAELLVGLLSEVVYLWDAESLLLVGVKVRRLGDGSLDARLGVIPADPARHRVNEPVKAVTYHQAKVEPRKGRWRGEVFLDV